VETAGCRTGYLGWLMISRGGNAVEVTRTTSGMNRGRRGGGTELRRREIVGGGRLVDGWWKHFELEV